MVYIVIVSNFRRELRAGGSGAKKKSLNLFSQSYCLCKKLIIGVFPYLYYFNIALEISGKLRILCIKFLILPTWRKVLAEKKN